MLPVWVWAEARSDSPLVDMRMMRIPTVWTVNLVALLFGMGMYSMFAFLPQFLQTPDDVTGYGFGASVTESGLLLLPQTVATFLAGLLSGRLAARFGSKAVLVVGAGLTSLATARPGAVPRPRVAAAGRDDRCSASPSASPSRPCPT